MEHVPLAVLGAGLAGMSAALTLARAEHGMLLVGLPPGIEDKPGESLSVAATGVIGELDLADLLRTAWHRPNEVTHAAWGVPALAQRHAMMHPEGGGVILDRPRFERELADRVRASGAPWKEADVVDAEPETGGGWRLTLSDGSRVTARFVIDGTGRRSVIGRRVSSLFRADRLMAAYGFLTHSDPAMDPTAATLIESVPEGWWYACLLPDRRLSLAFFSDPDIMPRGISRSLAPWRRLAAETRFISQWLESATFEMDTPPRLASAATLWRAPVTGGDWILAGDAACAFDPLSSFGMTTALWTGRRAALAAMAALKGELGPAETYGRTLAEAMTDFLLQRARIYGAERRWENAPFWARRHTQVR